MEQAQWRHLGKQRTWDQAEKKEVEGGAGVQHWIGNTSWEIPCATHCNLEDPGALMGDPEDPFSTHGSPQ